MEIITVVVGQYKKIKETGWCPKFKSYHAGVLSFPGGNTS